MKGRYIDIQNLSKSYPSSAAASGEVHALDDVSLRIDDGERIGVIGANGAGKSTLLQAIAGVIEPTSGRVDVQGRVHAILTVGMGLRDEATGRENLFLDGAVQGRSRAEIESKLDEMIEFAELGEFIDQPVRTYSSGMKSRLGFASLVSIDPEILIVDEALAVGDAFFAAKATKAVNDLAARGAIVILVTHGLATIRTMCSRAIWIEAGRIRMDGEAEVVTSAYQKQTHERDEAEIARKFGAAGAAWSVDDSLTIDAVRVFAGQYSQPATVIEAGEVGTLSVVLSGENAAQELALTIWVERNDGLVLFEEAMTIPASGISPRELTISLGRLSWRPFLYQVHVEAYFKGDKVAHNACVLKVWSETIIAGGSPLLRDPIKISARRVQGGS